MISKDLLIRVQAELTETLADIAALRERLSAHGDLARAIAEFDVAVEVFVTAAERRDALVGALNKQVGAPDPPASWAKVQ